MKKFTSLLLVLVLVFSLGATTFAADQEHACENPSQTGEQTIAPRSMACPYCNIGFMTYRGYHINAQGYLFKKYQCNNSACMTPYYVLV